MTADTSDRTLSPERVERMVRAVRPDWDVVDAALTESGYTSVYRLTVGNGDDTRECVLKASPDGESHGIDTEARLLGVVADRTACPVPDVLGAVDDRDDLSTPFFLMESMPGEAVPFRDVGTLPDSALERLARETGGYLAELHAIDAVDAFGTVDHDQSTVLRGEAPPCDVDELTVTDSSDSWPALVRRWADDELGRLGGTGFADLAPRLRETVDDRIDALSGSFSPVLGRIDHGLHNLLIDSSTGEIRGMVDWAFTLAVTRAYDLACVEYNVAGVALSVVPEIPDRRETVRNALLDGYRSVATVPTEYHDHRELYELLAHLRSMNFLNTGMTEVPEEHVDSAAAGLRREVRSVLDGDER